MSLSSPSNKFDNKDQLAFETFLSYLSSISESIEKNIEEINVFLDAITTTRAFKAIQTKADLDLQKISKILRNAWHTEFQLNQLSINPDFAGYSLHWAQVYTYYACYLQIRTYLLSQKQDINPKHRTTLKRINEELNNRKDLFPSPWNLLCNLDPETDTFINKPNPFENNHQLSSKAQDNPLDNFSKFLKTTRKKELERKILEWKISNKKNRISPKAKQEIIRQMPPTSIFDCLYRLRIRANYENADTFIFSNISDHEALKFHNALQNIVWISSLIFETLISKYLSHKNYIKIVNEYSENMKSMSNSKSFDPMERYKLIKSRIK